MIKNRKRKGENMNGFSVAGLLFWVAGLISAITGNTPNAIMFVGVGMVFVALSFTRRQKTEKTAKKREGGRR